jgi:hypothetical protein
LHGQVEQTSLAVVAATTAVMFALAVAGYNPQRGLIKVTRAA